MNNTDYEIAGYVHDAPIGLRNAQANIVKPLKAVDEALHLVEHLLSEGRFYVSVVTDEAWIGCDGMYVDYGTFAGEVDCGERLSHLVRPLPENLDDLLVVLADVAEGLPEKFPEE